jgi:hypothetical protein
MPFQVMRYYPSSGKNQPKFLKTLLQLITRNFQAVMKTSIVLVTLKTVYLHSGVTHLDDCQLIIKI